MRGGYTMFRKCTAVLLSLVIMLTVLPMTVMAGGSPSISYQTHLQRQGWQKEVCDGRTGGSTGRALRLEAVKVRLKNNSFGGSVQYSTCVQRSGWQGWRSAGKVSGTTGRSLRMEAVRIRLIGGIKGRYDVYYRVYAQHFGWLGWAKNGAPAGTSGYAFRLEAMQVQLRKKGSGAPGSMRNAYRKAGPYDLKNCHYWASNGGNSMAVLLGLSRRRNASYPTFYYTGQNVVVGANKDASYYPSNVFYAANRGNRLLRYYGVVIGDSKAVTESKLRRAGFSREGTGWGPGYACFIPKYRNGRLVFWVYRLQCTA